MPATALAWVAGAPRGWVICYTVCAAVRAKSASDAGLRKREIFCIVQRRNVVYIMCRRVVGAESS